MNWDEYFMAMARTCALKSKDPSTKVGAVIVGPGNEIRSTGYNGFPRNVDEDVILEEPLGLTRWTHKPTKYKYVEHAERNAIYNAARVGTPTDECRVFMTAPPCHECARAIIQAGIYEVVYPEDHPFKNRPDWAESLAEAKSMLEEVDVLVTELYEGKSDVR